MATSYAVLYMRPRFITWLWKLVVEGKYKLYMHVRVHFGKELDIKIACYSYLLHDSRDGVSR